MEGVELSFVRHPIGVWTDIWLKSAEPEYDIIGGGITILDARTKDATGNKWSLSRPGISGFANRFWCGPKMHTLCHPCGSNERCARGCAFWNDRGSTLLELTGLVAANGVLAEGTRVETPLGTVVADGTAAFMITAANATPNLADRSHLYPPSADMPQVIYLGEEVGESELLDALAEERIDAVARGEIGNLDAVQAAGGAFTVTALMRRLNSADLRWRSEMQRWLLTLMRS